MALILIIEVLIDQAGGGVVCIGVSPKKVSPKSEDFCLNSDISTGCWLSCDIPFSNMLLGRERIERHRCKIQWLYGWAAVVRDCASANVRFCLEG